MLNFINVQCSIDLRGRLKPGLQRSILYRLGLVALWLMGLTVYGPTSIWAQTTFNWSPLGGTEGFFNEAGDWSPNGVPGTGDTARFNIGGNSSVLFNFSPTTAFLQHLSGNTVFRSTGGTQTYTLTGSGNAVDISGGVLTLGTAGNPLHLNINNNLRVNGGQLEIFHGSQVSAGLLSSFGFAGNTASIHVSGSGSALNLTNTSTTVSIGNTNGQGTLTFSEGATGTLHRLNVGGGTSAATQGTLNVLSGSTVTTGLMNIGTSANTGTVNVEGASSSLTQSGAATLTLGSTDPAHNPGTLNVGTNSFGATFTTGTGLNLIRQTGVLNVGNGQFFGTFNALGNVEVADGQINLSNSNSVFTAPELTISGGQVTRNSGRLHISSIVTSTANLLSVGHDGGSGTLTINSGGVLENTGTARIGNQIGSNGTVSVTGVGSQWTNSGLMYVGFDGEGNLNIESGGLVENSNGFIGRNSSSVGLVTVTGSGSQWNNNDLSVGSLGQGTLNIEDGGSVVSRFGNIGQSSGGTGSVTVSGNDSQWSLNENLTVGSNGQGTLNIQSGGLVTSTSGGTIGGGSGGEGTVTVTGASSQLNLSSTLFVGSAGHGTLLIENGGAVENSTGEIGWFSNGVGVATVTGSGSHWNNTENLLVGRHGQGTLLIENGGLVTNVDGLIGSFANSVGTVTVRDAGSQWNQTGDLFVGSEGQGTLTIAGGGSVTNTFGRIGWDSGSQGQVTVSGPGATWNNSATLSVGSSGVGELVIESGGIVTNQLGSLGGVGGQGTATVSGNGSEWLSSSTLFVGNSGQGTLNIESGGVVSNVNATIASGSNSSGIVNVSGAGSQWNVLGTTFQVGNTGQGTMNITDGGQVHSQSALASIGFSASSSQESTVTVSGIGSQWITDGLQVGSGASGTLNVQDGGYVASAGGSIGGSTHNFGAVVVTGPGSWWENSHTLVLGNSFQGVGGNGSLSIENGGLVSNTSAAIGFFQQSTASVLVTGSGSQWNSPILNVGNGGNGTLNVEEGGRVFSNNSHIALNPTSIGTATISGFGSQWNNSGFLRVANSGQGTLNINDGGSVSNTQGYVGLNANSFGEVVVSGTDSLWHNTQALYLAGDQSEAGGTGVLTIGVGGTVRVGETMQIWDQGTLNMLGGTLHLDGHDYQRESGATVNFLSGTLRLNGDRTLGLDAAAAHLFGTAASIATGQTLQIDGTATLLAPVAINGGTFRVENLNSGSLMSLNSGTFHLTASDLTVGNGGLFGDVLALGNHQVIQVDQHTNIHSDGILAVGQGGKFQSGSMTNQGQVLLDGTVARVATTAGSGFVNHGLLWGSGSIEGNFINSGTGVVHVQPDRLMSFNSVVENQSGGRITGRGTYVAPGIENHGEMLFSGGFTEIHAPIVGYADSKLIVTGGATTTVMGDVEFKDGSELRLSTASSAVFFDHVQFRDGALLTGDGQAYFEGSMGVGNSPSRQEFGFNVTLGQLSNLIVEIGGTDSQLPAYDQFVFFRDLTLQGGTLTVDLIGLSTEQATYAPQPGDTFQIFEVFGEWTGQFGSYDLPELYKSFYWNTSELYTQGILRVQGLLTETDSLLSTVHPRSDKHRSPGLPGTTSNAGSAQSIPEPSCGALVGMAALAGLFARRRKLVTA